VIRGKEERWEGPELEAHREAAMAVVAASVLAVTTSLRRPAWTRGHRGEAGTLAPSAPFKPGVAVRVGGEGGHIWGVPCGGKEGGVRSRLVGGARAGSGPLQDLANIGKYFDFLIFLLGAVLILSKPNQQDPYQQYLN
jgi:hypothetical protein